MKKLLLLLLMMFFYVKLGETLKFNHNKTVIVNDTNKRYLQLSVLKSCGYFMHEQQFFDMPFEILNLMVNECKLYNIPYNIFFKVVDVESGFRDVSNFFGSNAKGYMQLMPQTFYSISKEIGLKGGETPENNIKAGAYLLYASHQFWKQSFDDTLSWRLAVAQYEVGLGTMQIKDSSGMVIGYQIPIQANEYVDKIIKK